jgi:hypothetical protein
VGRNFQQLDWIEPILVMRVRRFNSKLQHSSLAKFFRSVTTGAHSVVSLSKAFATHSSQVYTWGSI